VNQSTTIAVFGTHTEAETAVRGLQKQGFDMKKLSIVGQDFHTEEQPLGFYNLGDRVKRWGKFGAFWGSIGSLLFGSLLLFVPVVGHVIVLGPLASALVEIIEGAAIGGSAGVLGGALASIGVPKDSVVRYESALKAGRFLVVAQGSASEIEAAHAFLVRSNPIEATAHSTAPTK
jgi:hypothetical protein